jgi:hypothetical protein
MEIVTVISQGRAKRSPRGCGSEFKGEGGQRKKQIKFWFYTMKENRIDGIG